MHNTLPKRIAAIDAETLAPLVQQAINNQTACITQWTTEERHGGTFAFNRKIGTGSTLSIPKTHTVRRAETLWGISQSYGVSVAELAAWNRIKDTDNLKAGRVLALRPE